MYKDYLNIQINLIIITVVAILLIISSINLSFAKDDHIDIKDISMADNNNKIEHNDIKEKTTQNDLLNDLYPGKFFLCGYPQELITDYNLFEKIKCN
ncbi:MAG TPA: hypothetical protein VFV86_02850 [Nitrososphaeraceae archaeon]|nr:hypothetical protein [Nitrososphaeraceae archaeon]